VSATTLPVIGTLLAAVPDPAGPGQQLALLSQQVLGAAAQLSMHRTQTCELTAVGYLRQHNADLPDWLDEGWAQPVRAMTSTAGRQCGRATR
jgi:hypothetical protein